MTLSVNATASGKATASATLPTSTTTLTTSVSNTIVVVSVHTECITSQGGFATVNNITDTNGTLTWARRSQTQGQVTGTQGTGFDNLEVWWAFSSGILTGVTITAHLTGKTLDDGTIVAIAVTGFTGSAYQTNPWDANASLPASASNLSSSSTTTPTTGTFSTTSANVLVIQSIGSQDAVTFSAGTIGGSTGTINVTSVNNSGTNNSAVGLQSLFFAAAQTNITAHTGNASRSWLTTGDALAQAGTSSAVTPVTFGGFFDAIALRTNPEFQFAQGPFAGTSPALSSPYVQAPFFDAIRPKQPAIDVPQMVTPSVVVANVLEQAFFDPVALRRIQVEAPPIIHGVSPALSSPYVQAPFFEPVRTKQPLVETPIIIPGTNPGLASPYVQKEFFEVTKLKPVTAFDAGPWAQTSPALSSPYVQAPFFDTVKLKFPSEFLYGPFAQTSPALANPYWTTAFFEAIKLKQPVIDVPQLVVVSAFAQPEEIEQAFFDVVALRRAPVEAPPIIPGTTPPLTAVYALTDWFARVALKQPIIDQPVVVFFPSTRTFKAFWAINSNIVVGGVAT